jgi:DNA primase
MAERPYVSFAEVKQKVPIPDVLEVLGIAERFQRKNDLLTGVCPLPGHQHGPSPNPEQFKINRKDGIWLWHCFGDCQRGGDVIELVKEMTGFDDAHVRFWFAERFADRLTLKRPREEKKARKETATKDSAKDSPEKPAASEETGPEEMPEEPPLKPLRFQLNLRGDVPYLQKRGLEAETIERYGIGLCNRGVLKGYIAIPVYAYPRQPGENPLAYLGRWPGDDFDESAGRPRYKWPEGFLKSRIVYGLAEALESPTEMPLIVVEGPFKVYHLFQVGFSNVVAIFGSDLSDQQAAILAATGRPIVLVFDGDSAGQCGMRAAAGKLITRAFVRVVKLPDGVEPDELAAEELAELLP